MDPTKPQRLQGTRVFLAGSAGDQRQEASIVDLGNPETIKWLKANGITKVFCVFPTTNGQFRRLTQNQKVRLHNLQEFFKRWNINPEFKKKLKEAGIAVRSLVREPKHTKGNESFVLEAAKTRGNFLIQCFAGRQVSAAYAMLYLVTATPMNLAEIRKTFAESGRSEDMARIEEILEEAGVKIEEIIERKQTRKGQRVRGRRKIIRARELERRRTGRKV